MERTLPVRSRFVLAGLLVLVGTTLSGCGSGVGGIVTAITSGGGGGGGSARPPVSRFSVTETKTSPCTIAFSMSRSSNVRFRAEIDGENHDISVTDDQGITGTSFDLVVEPPGNPPRPFTFLWSFATESLGLDESRLNQCITVYAAVPGLENPEDTTNAATVSLGNDASTIEAASLQGNPAEDVVGLAALAMTLRDTRGDTLFVRIEYDAGDGHFILASPADLAAGAPRPAEGDGSFLGLRNVPVPLAPGVACPQDPLDPGTGTVDVVFLWDVRRDLGAQELPVRIRLTPLEEDDRLSLPSRLLEGVPFDGLQFTVDNNGSPVAFVDGASFTLNASDQRRGIPVPFSLQDDEGDVVDVLFQWTLMGEPFPRLEDPAERPLSTFEIRSLIVSASQSDRERLRIATELPRAVGGRVSLPIKENRVRLPELAGPAAGILGPGGPRLRPLLDRELEILRDPLLPVVSLRGTWTTDPLLDRPVGALARGDGRQAIVLEDTGGTYRIRRVDLATGEVGPTLATGKGSPTVLAPGPEEDTLLLAVDEDGAGSWAIIGVCLVDEEAPGRVSTLHRREPANESGRVNGLTSLGKGSALLTVGSSLVLLEYDPLEPCIGGVPPTPPSRGESGLASPSRATTLIGPSANPPLQSPHGLVLDPTTRRIVYVAESLADRITVVDLVSLERRELAGGSGLPTPTALALAPDGRRLFVLAAEAIHAVLLNSDAAATRVAPASGTADPGFVGAVSLATGPDGLLLLAFESQGDLAVLGGLEQTRRILGHFVATHDVMVDRAFHPALLPGRRWRIQDRASRVKSTQAGSADVFVWDTRDVRPGGSVLLRAVPLDGDVGQGDSTFVPRRVASSFGGSICRIGSRQGEDARVPAEVIAVDIDCDGDLDLVSANDRLGQGLRIYRQISPGELIPEEDLGPPGNAATKVATGDFDGDGVPDLIGFFQISQTVRIFLQDPDTGAFDPNGVEVATVSEPESLAVSDLDGDGDLDFVVSSGTLGTRDVRIFLQEDIAEGTFTQAARLGDPTVLENPRQVVAADLDGDLHVDLVVADVGQGGGSPAGGITIFHGRGTGQFEEGIRIPGVRDVMESPIAIAARDVDGDGDLDLVSANRKTDNLSVLRQGPRRVFQLDPVVLGDARVTDSPLRVALADVDRDGDMDVISTNQGSKNVTVFFQSVDGSFDGRALELGLGEGTTPESLAVGDLDGDGLMDAVVADSLGQAVILLRSSGGGAFSPMAHPEETSCVEAPAGPEALLGGAGITDETVGVSLADLDRDGDLDLAVAHLARPGATVFLQGSPGRFEAAIAVEARELNGGSRAVSTLDLDGDGLVDLAVVADSPAANPVILFRQVEVRPGTFELWTMLAVDAGRQAVDLALADVDGDGLADVVVAVGERTPLGPGFLRVFFQDDTGGFTSHDVSAGEPSFADPSALSVADIDGDGRLDLVSANSRSNTVTVFRQMENRTFTLVTTLSAVIPLALEVADLDGDGDVDLVVTEEGDVIPAVVVFLREADGSYRTIRLDELGGPRFPGRQGTPRALALGDVDGDHDLDIAVAIAEAGTGVREDRVLVFFQDGSGQFRNEPVAIGDGGTSIRGPFALRIADVDGDGDLDLVSGNLNSSLVVVSYGSH